VDEEKIRNQVEVGLGTLRMFGKYSSLDPNNSHWSVDYE
jgi:hypothetical protein